MLEHFGYDFKLPEVSRIERAVLSVRAAVSQKYSLLGKLGLILSENGGIIPKKEK